jgi:UDP-N-acetylmuramoyl-L-alanyl-D-glutamate--2,6-diaminopimelate ligase
MKTFIRSLLPEPILRAYHFVLAYGGAVLCGFPSRKLVVIAVTGTKGKSSTVELIAELLRASGKKVASASTIRFSVGDASERNLFKMTMPGRFFLQKFLRRAVDAGCTHAVVEMTSEGALQYRHKGVELDALVFTNLQPEHLERHGGFELYAAAKLLLAKHLEESPKRPRTIVANLDDTYGQKFLDTKVEVRAPYSLKDAEPYTADDRSLRFTWHGELFSVPLPGLFNLYNCLAALALGERLGLERSVMKRMLEHMPPIAGRAERVVAGQPFDVVVDYAHTPESLRALYETFKNKRIIGVLGSMGGGRDVWKHPQMGQLADEYCDVAILTEEDPYDDDPAILIANTAKGFARHRPKIVPRRRDAIREALKTAKDGDAVLITGKGTDPYIMGPRGTKQVWSDAAVAREELAKLGYN